MIHSRQQKCIFIHSVQFHHSSFLNLVTMLQFISIPVPEDAHSEEYE